MSDTIRRIGILTGGGDCPGLNAVIRVVTKTAINRYGLEVIGILDGFAGLIENRMIPLNSDSVSGILTIGGTILGTNNKCSPLRYHVGDDENGEPIFTNVTDRCLANIESNELDALIIIGGDGTMSCTAPLVDAGVNCIGVPKTIDNDIYGTEITFGFLTAVETATEALDRLHSTAASHHRAIVCEVMGRNAGWIALHSGIASGSDVILLPEIPFDLDVLSDYVTGRSNHGRGFSMIACAEGARPRDGSQIVRSTDNTSFDPIRLGGVGAYVADELSKRTGIDTRTTVLGHVQRGGTPIAADRLLATRFGHYAVELLMHGKRGRMVVRIGQEHEDIDLLASANKQRLVPLDHPLIDAARGVLTCFGDTVKPARVATMSV